MNREKDELHITLRRINGAWRVVADDGVEHTHQHAFADRRKAWCLVEEIRDALSRARSSPEARRLGSAAGQVAQEPSSRSEMERAGCRSRNMTKTRTKERDGDSSR